jgi:transposase
MPRTAELEGHLSSTELQQRYLRCDHRADRTRWHALWLVSTGKSGNEAARLVGRTSGWISVLVRSYNEKGTEGVTTIKRKGQQWGGSEAALRWSTEEETQLCEAIIQAAPDGGVWTAAKVAAWLSERRGRKVHLVTGWRTLRRLRQSRQLPRPQHPQAAGPEDQAAFQKNARDVERTASDTPR